MSTKKKENKATEDPMKGVEVGKNKERRYDNVYEEKAFKAQIIYSILHARDWYKHYNKCSDAKANIFKEVVEEYFKEVSKAIIQKNYAYMWYRIGEFFIAKFNGSPMLNSYKSKEHKKVLSYVNLHSSGWVYQWYWATSRSVFHNTGLYEFKAIRGVDLETGRNGVKGWIRKLHASKELSDYNAFVRNTAMIWKRRKKREAEKAEQKRKEAERIKKMLY